MIILLAKLQWTLSDMTVISENNMAKLPDFVARCDVLHSASAMDTLETQDHAPAPEIVDVDRNSLSADASPLKKERRSDEEPV